MSKVNSVVTFRLHSVELIESSINQPPQFKKRDIDFHFDINVEIKSREENQLLIAICNVNVTELDSRHLLGSVKTAIAFRIENWTDFYELKTKKISLPPDANITFNSIAISTTRGIMFSYFRGTFLHNAFLPVVDPKAFEFMGS